MDYYLISAAAGDPEPAGILVEEFVLGEDHTTTAIDSAAWEPRAGSWAGASALTRELRSDAGLRARVAAVDRPAAARALTVLGGGELPDEARLRALFQRQPLPAGAPLDLGTEPAARRYRILFAGLLGERELAGARTALRLEPADDPRVAGTARDDAGGHGFTWELRRIGAGIAWCVDVTVRPGQGDVTALGALLHHHRQAIRRLGLIPVTVERFA
ncbi:hypothetical protein SAMN05421869_101357 [Nonomuraea jiangxiensis]|uniref:Uncharacterized protein n=1 Tax=Nonomuraea jiangxiensis TaxID=633440 RepID=A0A1G7ZA68_9ACTN|nr:hypothetical protein SAMN05421869_101357 [Nonomuraea jiangxiensis]